MKILIDTEKKRAEILSPVTIEDLRVFLKTIDPDGAEKWTVCVSLSARDNVSTTWIDGKELSYALDKSQRPPIDTICKEYR